MGGILSGLPHAAYLGVGAIVAAGPLRERGLFAVVTFTAPLVTEVARLGPTRHSRRPRDDQRRHDDRQLRRGATADGAVFVGFFLAGCALAAVTSFVQVALMDSVPMHPQLGSSMNSMCANAGSVTGGVCATVATHTTGGYGVAVVVGVVLTGVGVAGVAAGANRGFGR